MIMSNVKTDKDRTVGTHRVPADSPDYLATQDLLYVFNSNFYINEKGYLQKLIELLYELGYYKNNKSLFS